MRLRNFPISMFFFAADRLSNFDIDVFRPKTNQVLQLSNFQQGINSRCHYQPGGLPQNQMLNVTCTPGTYGRYVRIRLRGDNPMTLCEVEIFGAQTLTLFGQLYFLTRILCVN